MTKTLQVFRAPADEPGAAKIKDFRNDGFVTAANSLSASALAIGGGVVVQIGQARFFLASNEEIILIPKGFVFADYPFPESVWQQFFGKAVA